MASSRASQDFVPVKEIRDGVIIMKDGSMKLVLMASSINFELKSVGEQESIILQFQNFLNSLDFSVEFLIQSRKYDIRPYIALLEDRERQQVNDLLKIQTREYINFVKSFTEATNIMSKNFFIIVHYAPAVFSATGAGMSKFFFGGKKASKEEGEFETNRSQLEQRAYVVQQGLIRSGIRTALLGTQEVIELLYRMFNPGEQEKPIKLT